jgi:hypothetical protein
VIRALGLLALLWAATPAVGGEILPADGFAEGWRPDGALRTFTGPELYGHINGGSEVFLELGFDHLQVQHFLGPDGQALTAEIYVMSDPVAALGIYLLRCGRVETAAPVVPFRNTVGDHQLSGLSGHVYVTIANPNGAPGAAAAMRTLAASLRLPAPATAPDPFAVLPASDPVPGTARIVRGPFTLQDRFTLGDGDVLSLSRAVTAVAVDRVDARGDVHTLLVVPYPDEAAAVAAFQHLSGHLDRYLEVVERTDAALVLRDYRGSAVRIERAAARITVRYDRP